MSGIVKRILFVIVVLVLGGGVYLPHYLAVADAPAPADVIVAFTGPDQTARDRTVQDLLAAGLSDWVLIPAAGAVRQYGHTGPLGPEPRTFYKYPVARHPHDTDNIFEDTHLELVHAKTLMDRFGFKSAMLVSSPYHMRRIRLIARFVFDRQPYKLYYVPSNHEKLHKYSWMLHDYDRQWVFQECGKIGYFYFSILMAEILGVD